MTKRTYGLFATLAAVVIGLFLMPGAGFAAEQIRIALLPFNVYTKGNAAFVQNAVYDSLARELQKTKDISLLEKDAVLALTKGETLSETDAMALGRRSQLTHVLTGSFTEIGEEINIDCHILDVEKDRALPVLSVQGKGMGSLGILAARLRGEILLRISARQRIARIEFEGNQKIESSVMNQVLKGSQGNLFSETQLSEDIKAIYKLGYFDDVSARVTDTPEGKVIVYTVSEKGLVTSIAIKGNKAVDTSDIEAAMTFKTRQALSPEKIAVSIEKIKALYDAKGYYNVEIGYAVEKVGAKDQRVVFTIKENEKLYVRRITFEGNRSFRDKELKNIMKTAEKDFFSWFTDAGLLKKEQLRQDVNKLNAFYLNNGFIYASVGDPDITIDKKGIYIKIAVSEGRRFKVGKVSITGDELKVSRERLLKGMTIGTKEFFDRGAIIKDMEYLTGACNDEGYAYADVTPKTTANDKEQTVDVTYDIFKSHIVYFNRIVITGNHKTRDKVIRRMLAFSEGDMYNSSNLKQSYKNLERMRFFEEMDFQAEKGPDETRTDINIKVKEKSTGMFSIGAGYSALDGAMAMASISQQNLFGRGQSLSLKATLGANASYYDLSFVEPWLFDTYLWAKIDIWNTRRYYDTYTLTTWGFSPTLGYPLFEKFYGYLQYSLFQSDVSEILDTASYLIKLQAGKVMTSAVSPTISRDTTDDDYFPTKGSRNSIYLTYAGGPLGGDTSFTKYGATTAWFFGLPLDMVFDIKGHIGYLQPNQGKPLPIYERYYIGGINTVRGLRYVGPHDPITGDLIGGTTMLYFNADLVFPLIKNAGMRGVVFFDTGNAWESGYHLGDMRRTAGVGVRWYSPVGPLRLEWGYVLDRKDGEDPSRFEFTMGMMM